MFQVIIADLIILPTIVFIIAKFGHRQEEPEWLQLSRIRAYMRSPEFIKKHGKLIKLCLKGDGNGK